MANDEDLEQGLRNIQEILQRLDDRVQNVQWLKEHAPADAPERIKEAITENFPAPRYVPPQPEPPAPEPVIEIPAPAEPLPELPRPVLPAETAPVLPEPAPLPKPSPAPAPLPAKEPPPAPKLPEIKPFPAFDIKPEPKPAEPPIIKPEPVKLPEIKLPPAAQLPPLPKPPLPAEPPALPPLPEPLPAKPFKDLLTPPAELPTPAPAPTPAPEPAPARAKLPRKPFVINKTVMIVLGTALAASAGIYQLTLNSAAHRYAKAGQLVAKARNAEAISAYSRIITQYPRSIEAAYSEYAIGDIKALQGDSPAAIEHYEHYLVAAPAGDAKIASARFKIAELELKEDLLADAEFLFQNAAIQASEYAGRAAERVTQIRAVKTQVAEAKKLTDKAPDKAIAAYTAVLAEHPKYAAALTGLEEARKAFTAAQNRPAPRRAVSAPKPVKPQPAPVKKAPKPAPPPAKAQPPAPAPEKPAQPAPAPAPKAAADPKAQYEGCSAVWAVEKAQGQLDADMIFTKVKFGCDALKEKVSACREAREEVNALKGITPEARMQMEQEIDPDWDLAKQLDRDRQVLKNYTDRNCAALLKSVPD